VPEGAGRILVTGGSGFLGRHVVRSLAESGAHVTVADLVPYPDERMHCVVGDLRDRSVADRVLTEGTDAVVHLAALTSVLESANRPVDTYRTNVEMTVSLLERSRLLGVPRFVLASTNAVVGEAGGAVLDERSALRPLTPYGATKAAAEVMTSAYSASYGIAGSSLRFTNVFGPGMGHKDSVVARLMKAALSGGSIDIYGDGEQSRDYIYISDAVSAVHMALEQELTGTYVVGSGRSVSVNELHRLACEATEVEIPAGRVPARPGEMRAVVVDNGLMRARGWRPAVGLAEGLRRTWAYFCVPPEPRGSSS
jgi:UDP-glucose 4-epimerase